MIAITTNNSMSVKPLPDLLPESTMDDPPVKKNETTK
jgi:hypothetical protein